MKLHPAVPIPVLVTLPRNVIPCPECGEHYVIDGPAPECYSHGSLW